jgi:hypothetical protein
VTELLSGESGIRYRPSGRLLRDVGSDDPCAAWSSAVVAVVDGPLRRQRLAAHYRREAVQVLADASSTDRDVWEQAEPGYAHWLLDRADEVES